MIARWVASSVIAMIGLVVVGCTPAYLPQTTTTPSPEATLTPFSTATGAAATVTPAVTALVTPMVLPASATASATASAVVSATAPATATASAVVNATASATALQAPAIPSPVPTPPAGGMPTALPYATRRASLGATFLAVDSTAWQPFSVSLAPTGLVTWENWDTTSAHPVECVQAESGPCPWQGQLALAPAQTDTAGQVVPSAVTLAFPRPGIFVFRDALHTKMRGEVVVGAPGRVTPSGAGG
jgi:hypothetical protein